VTLRVRTTVLENDRPLLELLPDLPDDERFVFVQDGEGLVGWGVAARIAVGTGPGRFTRARTALADLAGDSPSGPGPIAFASFAFDEDEDSSVMVVPGTVVLRRDGVTHLLTIGEDADDRATPSGPDTRPDPGPGPDTLPGTRADGQTQPTQLSADRPRHAGSTVRDDVWLEAVARAVTEISADEYEKVVLARDLHLWSRTAFDTTRVLGRLAQRFPSCMTFLVDHLLGASPERLLRRTGGRVSSRVLAGTTCRGADAAEDVRLGAALLTSDKDLHEHDLAVRSAVGALSSVCTTLDVPDGPSLVRLDNVQHLGSDLEGTLDPALDPTTDTHVLTLVARLHPTAAVGGAPRAEALDAIGRLEGMSRGRYAGPVGWCTPDGDGEFAIALRCAEIRGERARLFAGAGIVAGSLPESELTETWLKLRAMTGVLDV
jgi:menaquinone-specific isochorismate synthase